MKLKIFSNNKQGRKAIVNIDDDVSTYVNIEVAEDSTVFIHVAESLTPGEIRVLIEALEFAIYLAETDEIDINTSNSNQKQLDITLWQDTFRNHICSLDLSVRVQNCILRGLGGVNGVWMCREAFSKDDRLLSFDEWRVWIHTSEGRLGLKSLRNFGEQSYKNLLEAVPS